MQLHTEKERHNMTTAKTEAKIATSKSIAAEAVKSAKAAKEQTKKVEKSAATKTAKNDTRLFQYAGVSTLKGKMRLRFTNNYNQRMKTFKRDGDTDVRLIDFEKPASKKDLAKMMLKHEQFQDKEAQELLKKLVD